MDHKFRSAVILAALISACVQVALAQTTVQEARVRAHMEFLASATLHFVGSEKLHVGTDTCFLNRGLT